MEIQLQSELQRDSIANSKQERPPSSSMGWPFGLPTCIAIQTPSPNSHHLSLSHPSPSPSPSLAFHQQFMNLQTTFLLPFFSDAAESSSSDSDYSRSEAASSSFFKDSRRITLGSLIGLPMDHSFHHLEAYHGVFATTTTPRRSAIQLPSCGILELLRCGLTNSASTGGPEFRDSEHEGEMEAVTAPAVTARSPGSLAAFLQLEMGDNGDDDICGSMLDAVSNGSSHSPDWNGQFVSCHSILSDALTEQNGGSPNSKSLATPKQDSKLGQNSNSVQKAAQRMQRSTSVKSFFSSICCRIDAVQRP